MNFKIGPVRLRSDEYEAEILCIDMGGDRPILARFRRDDESWSTQSYSDRGRVFDHEISCIDLMPPKKELWVNVYPDHHGDGHGYSFWKSKELSDKWAAERIARIRVEFSEGQFDE